MGGSGDAEMDRTTRRLLHSLNRRLGEAGLKTTSFRELARELQADEIPGEMVRFLDRVESRLAEAGVPALVR
jgi:HEPN domain-containing protein